MVIVFDSDLGRVLNLEGIAVKISALLDDCYSLRTELRYLYDARRRVR